MPKVPSHETFKGEFHSEAKSDGLLDLFWLSSHGDDDEDIFKR